ncbi:uncharacterized protein LOC116263192 isoform X2 [Nymphaea colorata]|uniref:uncharacterized protein LOC116263192 isoform X2 n=1 Tax=Nymphaea colorata TaxID=210225 RepID=UPI00129E17A1|nr:uncharacterized protein LOC116263192 isoform X2 [Nymphaea colorata]
MGGHAALPEKDSDSSVAQCRICHEEEDNELKDMGSPCACSGTLKYAHRKCIQRWCNEKGDTICEICLQKFEPGFTVSAQTANIEQMPPLIRGELHTSSENQEIRSPGLAVPVTVAVDGGSPVPNFRGCSFSTCCRLVALMFTALLLILHALNLLRNGGAQYALTLFTDYDGDLQNHRYLDEDVQELYLRV